MQTEYWMIWTMVEKKLSIDLTNHNHIVNYLTEHEMVIEYVYYRCHAMRRRSRKKLTGEHLVEVWLYFLGNSVRCDRLCDCKCLWPRCRRKKIKQNLGEIPIANIRSIDNHSRISMVWNRCPHFQYICLLAKWMRKTAPNVDKNENVKQPRVFSKRKTCFSHSVKRHCDGSGGGGCLFESHLGLLWCVEDFFLH